MKKALILECWYGKSTDNWYPWLKKELEKKGYKVFVPELPTMYTSLPDMQKQLTYIEKNFKFEKDTLVFGHSLGCLLAMRLAEKYKYKKMYLIAGWDFDDLTTEHRLFWKTPINHKKIKTNVKKIYCFSSDNDPYITAIQSADMCKRLNGVFVLINGKSYFSEKQGGVRAIPQLSKYL